MGEGIYLDIILYMLVPILGLCSYSGGIRDQAELPREACSGTALCSVTSHLRDVDIDDLFSDRTDRTRQARREPQLCSTGMIRNDRICCLRIMGLEILALYPP